MTTRVASLEAVISGNVSGLQAAGAQAKSILNGIAKEAKAVGTELGGMDKWTRQSGVNMEKLDATVAKAKNTLASTVQPTLTFGDKLGLVRDAANNALTSLAKFGATAVATGYAVKKGYDFARVGAEIEYTGQKFDRLAKAAGSTGDVFIRELRSATRGTVSDFGLLKQGADLLQLGLARDTTEAVRLSKVMTALGMDTGELTLALANQSKRRLDQLGLSLTKFNEIEARLKKSGMGKEEAFREAFLQTAEQTMGTIGNRADSGLGNFLRLEAAGANVFDAAKQKAAKSPLVSDAANILQAMNMVQRGEMQWTGNLLQMLTTQGPVIRKTQAQDVSDLWRALPTNIYQAPKVGQSAVQSYTSMAYAAQQGAFRAPGVGAAGEAATPVDYGALLKNGLELSQMTSDFDAKTQALNETLAEEQAKLELLGSTYRRNANEYMEQADKVDQVKESITQLNEAYQESAQTMALSMLQNRGASEEQQAAFARAAGLITDDAYETVVGLTKLSEAYQNGGLSAEAYSQGVANLSGWVKSMEGLQVNTYIDVWVRTHGALPSNYNTNQVGSFVQGTGQGAAANWLNKQNKNRWQGGPIGDVNIVGDAPGGGWTPYTEAIINGYVVDAKTSKKLKDAGLLEGASALGFGGDIETPGSLGGGKRPPTIPWLRKPKDERRPSTGDPRGVTTATVETAGVATPSVTPESGAVMQVAANVQESTAQNFQNTSQQQIQAQQQSSAEMVAKLDEVLRAINKLPDKNDAYANARAGSLNV